MRTSRSSISSSPRTRWRRSAASTTAGARVRTPTTSARRRLPIERLRAINAVSATAFVFGGSLFALGAALAQGDVGGPRLAAAVYLAGGVFFTTGAYAGLLLVANSRDGRRGDDPDGILRTAPWRWWSLEPGRPEWASGVTLFVGTLFFFVSLLDALIGDLSVAQVHRLVWSPEFVGCILFLVSGQIALAQLWRGRRKHRDDGLDWTVALVNQLGSALFMVAAVAAFVRPATGDALAVGIANWGTLTGALCFAIAGAIQELERPAVQPTNAVGMIGD